MPPSATAVQLPTFDISNPTPEVGRSMIAAAAKYGFLYIDTKGIDFTEAIVDGMFQTVCASDEASRDQLTRVFSQKISSRRPGTRKLNTLLEMM
jgi:hypothetical protein